MSKHRLGLRRKLVSTVGRLDYARVRMVDGEVEPIAISGASILSSTTRADGFVVIPEDSEGYPAGADVIGLAVLTARAGLHYYSAELREARYGMRDARCGLRDAGLADDLTWQRHFRDAESRQRLGLSDRLVSRIPYPVIPHLASRIPHPASFSWHLRSFAGCSPWSTSPTGKSLLQSAKMSPDSVVVEVRAVGFGGRPQDRSPTCGRKPTNSRCRPNCARKWLRMASAAVSWAANCHPGSRIAWRTADNLLQLDESERTAVVSDLLTQRRIQCRANQHRSVPVGLTCKELVVGGDGPGPGRATKYADAQCHLGITAIPKGDGRVELEAGARDPTRSAASALGGLGTACSAWTPAATRSATTT